MIKKQVILVRGWEAKENYKDFYDFVEKEEYNPYKLETKRWNRNLWKILWEEYEIFSIPNINKRFADYRAWKITFEKVFPFLENDVIFIGHSLGWTFLTKYFEENNKILEKTKKIILVASWFRDNKTWEILWTFNFDKKLENLKKIQDKIIIFASKDDFLVPFEHFEEFNRALPKAQYKVFENKGHFLQEDFPELIEEIRKTK
jgi:predicted alpha/beta hydrolase family esterase